MSGQPTRIAVMGAGMIGRRHIEHIQAEPMAALHAIIDPAEAARAHAAACGVPWYPDLDAMLAGTKPDGVLIATPNQLHVAHGMATIAAGLPALVEKPLADDLAAAEQMVAAAARAGVPLLTGHHRRHNPMIRHAHDIIATGMLGRIIAVHGFFWLMKPDSYFDVPWRRQPGAGPVMLNMIHDIDLLRSLCGEIEAVQAFESNAVRGHPVNETTVVILRFASGALGTITVSDTIVAPWSWEHTTGENPAYPQADQNCYVIGGTHASLSIPRLEIWTNPARRGWLEPFRIERHVSPATDPLRRQVQQFCKVIRGEEPPLVSGAEGLATLKVIDAIQRAAASQTLVAV
ncbi:MAG: Gfo/Idh/MocA family oxidoreductase [Hyphomicrobiales bacterium]|jgi:predicted dehydrogenase|nr:Gfo/Idh/MocA family oxidoreductase [Hyphomicrobiales bacterium]